MEAKTKLEDFYKDARALMEKHGLVMECFDNYNGHGEWCGYDFTLRSKEPVNDRYPIHMESIKEFVENVSP